MNPTPTTPTDAESLAKRLEQDAITNPSDTEAAAFTRWGVMNQAAAKLRTQEAELNTLRETEADAVALAWKFKELTTRALSAETALKEAKGLLSRFVDEFGCTIERYHKIGPDFTFKDGTQVFDVGVVLDREDLIEEARAALSSQADRIGEGS